MVGGAVLLSGVMVGGRCAHSLAVVAGRYWEGMEAVRSECEVTGRTEREDEGR